MARSFKKTPVSSNTITRTGEMRFFRHVTQKKLRASTRHAINRAAVDYDEVDLLDPRTPHAVIARYAAPDDGKRYDLKANAKEMRK